MELVLPKSDENGVPYLSYSQISTWKKSKRDYIRQYFFGESFEGNAYTDFGSLVGESLENGDFSDFTKKEQEFLKTIPRYDEFEREIKLNLEGFYVKGYIDTNDENLTKLADYKTGDIEKKAEEYRSDAYNQLGIYAAALHQETGVYPKEAHVFLIDRKGNAFKGEELKLGDSFAVIKKDITPKKLEEVIKEVNEVALEISSYYKTFLKLNN